MFYTRASDIPLSVFECSVVAVFIGLEIIFQQSYTCYIDVFLAAATIVHTENYW